MLMSRNEFNEYVLNHIKEYLPKEYKTKSFEIRSIIRSDNENYTGLTMKDPISPCINLDNAYDMLIGGAAPTKALDFIAKLLTGPAPSDFEEFAQGLENWDFIKNRIFYRISSYEKCSSVIREGLNKKVGNILFSYHIYVGEDENGYASTMIPKEFISIWGVTEEEIFEIAKENTPKLFPPVINSMLNMLASLEGSKHYCDDSNTMLVLTNNKAQHGASAMFYPRILEKIANRINSNLYILPSSVHEVIILPEDEGAEATLLKEMVKQINETCLEDKDYLSDDIFYFDRETSEITVLD